MIPCGHESQIPWGTWVTGPVVIELHDVTVLATPRRSAEVRSGTV